MSGTHKKPIPSRAVLLSRSVAFIFTVMVLETVALSPLDVTAAELRNTKTIASALAPSTRANQFIGQQSDIGQTDDITGDQLTRKRLVATGIACGGVFSLLLILFVYLRLNHATRGFYSRRLQMGAASVVLIVVLLCYFLMAAFN